MQHSMVTPLARQHLETGYFQAASTSLAVDEHRAPKQKSTRDIALSCAADNLAIAKLRRIPPAPSVTGEGWLGPTGQPRANQVRDVAASV